MSLSAGVMDQKAIWLCKGRKERGRGNCEDQRPAAGGWVPFATSPSSIFDAEKKGICLFEMLESGDGLHSTGAEALDEATESKIFLDDNICDRVRMNATRQQPVTYH